MSIELERVGLSRNSNIVTIANLNPIYCKESEPIKNVADVILKTNHRRLPIVSKKSKLVGVVTITDLLDAFLRKLNFNEQVSAIMIRDVIVCNQTDTISDLLQRFKMSRRGGFPIVDKDKKLIGIVSERDLVKHFSNISFGIHVGEIMTKKPFVISRNISILDCLKSMVNTRYRRLPVVDGKDLVGMVTSIDLLRYVKNCNFKLNALDESLELVIIKNVITISKSDDVSNAIKIMKANDIGGILVTDVNTLEGIITEKDILQEII